MNFPKYQIIKKAKKTNYIMKEFKTYKKNRRKANMSVKFFKMCLFIF